MDIDQNLDCNLMRIKEKLNQNKIKLWLGPYYSENEGINEKEVKSLADSYSSQLSIPVEICMECIRRLQTKALDNLNDRSRYQNTGLATLKVKVPNGQRVDKVITIHIDLLKNGIMLKELISKEVSVPVERLKVIFQGKILKEDETLSSQGVKHGICIMAIALKNESVDLLKQESHEKLLDSMKKDLDMLTKNKTKKDYIQITDQSGNPIQLPVEEKTALILAMTLHEKGRAAIKKEDFALALVLLLEAEKEFSYCNTNLLKSVDNYGLLNMDIVWCYLNLQSVTQLPDAENRLHQCELSFQQSYGPNLERLLAVKGSAGNENALFMRLHLLQAIVLYHQNKLKESRELFLKVEQELQSLEVDDYQMSYLIEMGYTPAESRLALRQSNRDLNGACNIIENKRQDRKKKEEAEKKERELKREKKKLGKCKNGEWIEPQCHKDLMSMGYSDEVAKWALAQSCNSVYNSVNLIQEHPEVLLPCNENVTDDLVAQVVSLGYDVQNAKLALNKHKGNINRAVEELMCNGGAVVDSDSDSDSSSEENESPSTSRQHDEAYSRVSEGLSNCAEDYLDLNLIAEKSFLQKYKELLSEWKN